MGNLKKKVFFNYWSSLSSQLKRIWVHRFQGRDILFRTIYFKIMKRKVCVYSDID